MSGGSNSTTQRTESEPWEAAQPYLKTGMKAAGDIFESGDAFKPYTGSTVVPFADQTVGGMESIQSNALSALSGPNAFDKGFNFFGGMFDQGGLNADQRGVADQFRTTASGAELNNFSPEFENVLKRSLDDARTGVDMSMSGAGRYGSGAHTDVLGDTLGGISSQARLGEYGRQLGRMDTARTSLANLGQQGITNQFGAASALPDAWQARQAPAKDLMGLGSMYEDLAGRTMADNMRIFEETQRAPLDAVEWLNAIGSGAGQLGQSGFTSAQGPSPNPFVQALGIGMGANNLLGNPLAGMFGGGLVSPSIGMF